MTKQTTRQFADMLNMKKAYSMKKGAAAPKNPWSKLKKKNEKDEEKGEMEGC